jgi:hypothetical protein
MIGKTGFYYLVVDDASMGHSIHSFSPFNMFVLSLAAILLPLSHSFIRAQPSPNQQDRITAAIKAAVNQSNPDYTAFVNPFIGTGWFLTCVV